MKNKVDLLLITRGLLALLVIMEHLQGYKQSFPIFLNVPGRTAVWIFFGISGYVIAFGFFNHKYLFNIVSLFTFC